MTNAEKTRKTIADLIGVMAALRTPDTGCPWDLQQTFESIAPYTIEETYEVADAIVRGDLVDLKEELGDLLLQVVYHARMAQEQGAFDFGDVADGITRKMIRRHPHVFGTPEERAAGAQAGFWARIKAAEKAEKAAQRAAAGAQEVREGAGSALDDVPIAMPALVRAVKLQDKAAKVGFDWPSLAPVLDKLGEELGELSAVVVGSDAEDGRDRQAKIEEEFGDLLFTMANVARHLKLDPEAALRAANHKFQRRFGHIETRLAEDGRTPADSNLDEMDRLWNEAKRQQPGAHS
ncbi:MAG: nucleoside triphosphate pyrophosphohydrolase [Alphaproteobacteria bacterium]|nr:nucleoside triphosphate pyrophosphohydrolase [Alphaproteobacteria bacterium]